MIVNDASTINVIDDASLALASFVNYDRKWRYNLECHFDDTRSVNYDRNTFIIQATGVICFKARAPKDERQTGI
jgi:hypothetical protein